MRFPRKVYAIRHNVTNRVYIGSSCHVDKRFNEHLTALRSHRHTVEDMQADFDEYGDDFTLTIVDHIATIADKNKEYEWMQKNQSYIRGVGYNYNDKKWSGVDKDKDKLFESDEKNEGLTENEKELISLIGNSKNPGATMVIAAAIITAFLCGNNTPILPTPDRLQSHIM